MGAGELSPQENVMAIKLLIFDLDGVICDTSKVHFNALNKALSDISSTYCVSEQEDLWHLGTKTTVEKLKVISKLKGLPENCHAEVLRLKKQYTQKAISDFDISEYFDANTKIAIDRLKQDGFLVYLASNTNREFIDLIFDKVGLTFDNIYCNGDVKHAKPNPEMYLKSFIHAGVSPDECVIFEDSITGQEAAIRSGAHLFPVEKPQDITYDAITSFIGKTTRKPTKWHSRKLNVVIPMAGEGSRFKNAGWITPKPLIDVHGLPMVAAVVRDLNVEATFTFIIKEEHEQEYHLTSMLNLIAPECNIVKVSGKQSGAATTILQAQKFIDNDNHMMIVNSDNMWDWQANLFYYSAIQAQVDGSIIVFEDKTRDKKWSFAKLDECGYVSEVAEKNPISDWATAGIYYFDKGSDFVKYANQMVEANDRVNNEFYVCPVYNYMIKDHKRISIFPIDKFWPTGTPEELEYYLANRRSNDL
jgi:HAD superfamily hydrolase (TIGR01509 family)